MTGLRKALCSASVAVFCAGLSFGDILIPTPRPRPPRATGAGEVTAGERVVWVQHGESRAAAGDVVIPVCVLAGLALLFVAGRRRFGAVRDAGGPLRSDAAARRA